MRITVLAKKTQKEFEARLIQPLRGSAQEDVVALRLEAQPALVPFEEKKGRFKVTGPNGSQNGGDSGILDEIVPERTGKKEARLKRRVGKVEQRKHPK